MSREINSSPIVTLHGPDGCGKSTIAGVLNRNLLQDEDTLLIGASDFMQWLTPEIYEGYMGSSDAFYAGVSRQATLEQKTRLYEDIAICLYGVSERFSSDRGSVIVHSDPFLKRLVWARRSMTADQFDEYMAYFDEHVSSHIGETFATHLIDLRAETGETFARINARGTVSEYDPATEDENRKIHEAVLFVGRIAASAVNTLPRFADVKRRVIQNPTCAPDLLPGHTEHIAQEIEEFIKR